MFRNVRSYIITLSAYIVRVLSDFYQKYVTEFSNFVSIAKSRHSFHFDVISPKDLIAAPSDNRGGVCFTFSTYEETKN